MILPPHRLAAFALAAALAALLGATPSLTRAQPVVIEQVVATVNDEALFASDLRRKMLPFLPQVMEMSSQSERMAALQQLREQGLTRMIDEELIRQAARRMNITVTTEDVERGLHNVMEQTGLSEDELWEAIAEQGYSEAQYRADLRRQLLRFKVLNQRVRGRVNITEDDVRRVYETRIGTRARALRFRASHVFVPVPAGASATAIAAIREEVEALRAGLTQETFPDAVAAHGGGELGWLSQGDLPTELEDALVQLEPGGLSPPVRGEAGYHVFLLHERETGSADLPSYEASRDEIYRAMLDAEMQRQEQLFVEELRRSAVITRRI